MPSSLRRYPVSGATTPRGKIIFAVAIGALAYLIRVFGAFPDGIAFAVLILNMCVPLIDMYTQPPIFGENIAEMAHEHAGRKARVPGLR